MGTEVCPIGNYCSSWTSKCTPILSDGDQCDYLENSG